MAAVKPVAIPRALNHNKQLLEMNENYGRNANTHLNGKTSLRRIQGIGVTPTLVKNARLKNIIIAK